jgi:hypothetical protein
MIFASMKLPLILRHVDLSDDFLSAVRSARRWRTFADRTGWHWVARIYRGRYRSVQSRCDAMRRHADLMDGFGLGDVADVLQGATCKAARAEWPADDHSMRFEVEGEWSE